MNAASEVFIFSAYFSFCIHNRSYAVADIRSSVAGARIQTAVVVGKTPHTRGQTPG